MANKSRLASALEQARVAASKDILQQALADLGTRITMGELIDEMAESEFHESFRLLTVAELAAAGAGTAKATKARATSGRARRSGPVRTYQTRTETGREQIDAAVTEFLSSQTESVGAEEVRKVVGGTPPQVRESLRRLVESGQASRDGEKRSTRYTWGGKKTRKRR